MKKNSCGYKICGCFFYRLFLYVCIFIFPVSSSPGKSVFSAYQNPPQKNSVAASHTPAAKKYLTKKQKNDSNNQI